MIEITLIGMAVCYIGGIYVGRNWERFTEE